MFVKVFCR